MQTTRLAFRAQRTLRSQAPAIRRNARFASETAAKPAAQAGAGAVTGGLVGGGAVLAVTYAYYHFSSAKSAVEAAKQAKGYADSLTNTLKVKYEEKTPDTNQAIETLKQSAQQYASFVPGGRAYVDSAFNDLESVRKHHGDEVDNIVKEAYGELRDASKKDSVMEAISESGQVLWKHLQRLASVSGDAAEDILNNHPQLKEKVGGSTDQLKQLGERLGPQVKEEVDNTWKEINDVVKQGVSITSADKIRKLVQDKVQKIQQMGEKAFNEGFEQVKPLLEKSPQVKQFVEQNMDTLKSGNVTEVVDKVKSAVSSGSTQELEKYVQQAKEKTEQYSSSQLSSWLSLIPNGGEIIPQLQKLKDVAENKSQEGMEIAKEVVNEIKSVLDKNSEKVNELYEDGKKEVEKKS